MWNALNSNDDATRELAATALVVGKVLSTQSIAANPVDVLIRLPSGQTGQRTFDGVRVRAYYEKRITLDALLAE